MGLIGSAYKPGRIRVKIIALLDVLMQYIYEIHHCV